MTDKFSTKDSDLKKYFSKKIENLRHFYEPIFTDKENGLIENSLSQAQRKGFISEQNNVINTNNLDLYRAQIKNNQEKQKDLYDYLLYLQTHGGDSETIAKTISELQTLNTEITDLDKKVTETKDTISNNVRTYGNELQDDYSYRKQLNSDYYGLGQTFSKGRGQENGLLRKNNIELNREIAEIEGRIRREGLKNGKSESQINNEILADKNLQDLKKTVNQNLSQIKDNIKSDLDDILENLDRNVKKLELTKPEKWSAIPQIKRYYNGIREEYKNSLEELEHYLATATNLSLDEQKDLYDQINQMKKNLLDNDISRVSDIIAYQETIYSALQYQVNDYIDTLNEEKDLVSKRYDEEIKKLQQVNTDKERSIKLTQLQQDLENAQKQKKRVYRAGVGFVYEADRAEEKKARQSLDSFYREDKISDLNTAKDLETSYYDKKIEGWNTYLKGIEKVYKTEERLQNQELLMKELNVKSVEELNKKLIDDRDDYVIEVAKNNAKYKFFNTEYKGCWSDFLDSYNSNVRQLRIYQEEELKLRSEYLKAYKDAYVQTYDKTTTADIKDVLNFTHQYGITDIQDLIHKMSEDQTLEKHYSGLGYGIDKLQSFHETKQNYFETLIKDPKLDISSILLGRSANTTGLNFEELRQLLYNKLNYLQSNDPTIDVDSRFKEAENLIAQENKNHILLGDISKYSDAQNANLQGMKKDFSGKMSKIVNSNLASDQKQQAISDLLSETYDVLASTSEMQNNSQNVINTMKNWVVNDGVYNSFRAKLDEIIDTIDSEKKNVDINNNSSSSSSKTGGTIRQVHVDGTAPVGTKIGDIVRTGGGDYKVVDKNTKNAKFNKKSGLWSIKLNANGSKGTTTKDFIAGEKGPEIGILPDGTSVIYGENGPALYEDQPLGTVIFPADKSSNLLSLHENGTVDWDSYNTPRFISKDNSFYPSYSSTLPKFESNGSKGDVYYNIEKVDLPNVKDPENFWTKLNEGVRRHMKDK